MKTKFYLFLLSAIVFTSCHNNIKDNASEIIDSNAVKPPLEMGYSVLKVYPHDTTSFTEGLLWANDHLYESTGMKGESGIIKAKLETGKSLLRNKLSNDLFGEGLCILNNKIYQLTWQDHKVFVYDMNFKKLPQEFEWPFEGWGMTTNGKQLIISTGSSNIYFVNPETFKIERTLGVSNNNGYVDSINELEFVNGYIYANVWQSDYILKINAQSGLVEARADLSQVLEKNNLPRTSKTDVLNGIAYNSATQSFYITGKYWPAVFEIKFN